MYVGAASFAGGSTPGLSIILESMSYTDMKDGIWFSYIRGPAVDCILSLNLQLRRLFNRKGCTRPLDDLWRGFLAPLSAFPEIVSRSWEGGVECVTEVKDPLRHRLLAF